MKEHENKISRKRLAEINKENNKYQIKKWTHCAEEK